MSDKPAGSPTNASDAVDDIELEPGGTEEEVLDAGVQHTFPASDPIAVQEAYERRLRHNPARCRSCPT